MKKRNSISNAAPVGSGTSLFEVKNLDGDGAAEVYLYDDIGSDPWTGKGITAKMFSNTLATIGKHKDLDLHINSAGGDVWEGMAIKSQIDAWPGAVNAIIDGIAASTASWIPMACDKITMAKHSQMFIHDAWGVCQGNAADMDEMSDRLDKTSDQVAAMYSERSGKGKITMRNLMKDATLLTGEECKEMGLCDVIADAKSIKNFTPRMLNSMRAKLAAVKNKTSENIMNKKQMTALLNKMGVTIPADATDEKLIELVNALPAPAAPVVPPVAAPVADPKIATLENRVNALSEINNALEKTRLTNAVQALVDDDRIPANMRDEVIATCCKDPAQLAVFSKFPQNKPGADPLAVEVKLTGESFEAVNKFAIEQTKFINSLTIGPVGAPKLLAMDSGQKNRALREISNRGVEVAKAIQKNKANIVGMWNSNTIDAGLQRQVILQEMLEEYAIVLTPLRNFSVVHEQIPLEGTDEVDVPFYPLQAAGQSNSWAANTGYNTAAGTAVNTRKVYVGGSGTSSGASAPTGYAKDRKWIMMAFSSYEYARQPYVNWEKLGRQNANRLAVDIFTDIVSRVITAANYGASVKAVPPQAFSADDIADLCESATGRNWPVGDRALVLNHTYRTPLLKDTTYKQYLSYGSTDPVRKAIIQEAYGFSNLDIVPNLTNYSPAGENLVGWINHIYAMIVATAQIMPTEEVRALMTRYDIAVHPSIGLTLAYRRFGDLTLDQTKEVVESSYGAGPGVASSLARITSQ